MIYILGGGGVLRIEEQQKLWWGFFPSVLNVFVLNSQGIIKTLVTSNGYCVKLQDASVLPLNFM